MAEVAENTLRVKVGDRSTKPNPKFSLHHMTVPPQADSSANLAGLGGENFHCLAAVVAGAEPRSSP
ncbi:MAG: hypothetical protein ACRDR6_06075 [Pseudonocardiaceae bacterium]